MSNNKKKGKSVEAAVVISIILSALLALGVMTLFSACGSITNGITMNCQYAQITVYVIAVVMTALSVGAFFARGILTLILRIAVIILALAAAIIPGNVISLCMSSSMSCQAMMRPYTIFMSVAVIVCTVIGIALRKKNG